MNNPQPHNQDNVVTAQEQQELDALIHFYEHSLLRKSQAL